MYLRYEQYTLSRGLEKIKTKTAALLLVATLVLTGGLGLALASLNSAGAATTTTVVTPTNLQGWIINPDPNFSTNTLFTTDQSSIGNGSLYAGPIDNLPNNNDKLIIARELKVPVSDFTSLSYDFLVAGDGTVADTNQFYVNVYATVVNDNKFYDCRYDYVATNGTPLNFATATVVSSAAPTNVQRAGTARIASCPATLNLLSTGFVRAISVNMGDTSANDTDLAGYFDNFILDIAGTQTVHDFETALYVPTTKDDCKNGGWMNFQTVYKNQGLCVASVQSNTNSKHNR